MWCADRTAEVDLFMRVFVRVCCLIDEKWCLLWFILLILLSCFMWWRTSAASDLVWREWSGFRLCGLPSLFWCAGRVRAVSIVWGRLEDLKPGSRYLPWACPREVTYAERHSLSFCSWTTASEWAWSVDVGEGSGAKSETCWASVSACAGDCNCLDCVGGDCAGTQGPVSLFQLLRVSD